MSKAFYSPAYQSFMTTPEWKNVEISEDLTEFLKSNNPLHHFFFLREAYETNRIFCYALWASLKYNTAKELLFPEQDYYNYFVMDLFVVLMTNISMLCSKLFCLWIQLMMFPYTAYSIFYPEQAKNNTQFQEVATNYYKWFVNELNVMPFYNVDYTKVLAALRSDYASCTDRTWVDHWTMCYMVLEINTKILLSPLMRPDQAELDVTPATVCFTPKNTETFQEAFDLAMNDFKAQLNNGIKAQDELSIKLSEKNDALRITTPRYHDLKSALQAFAAHGITIERIAGQDRIQIKFICEQSKDRPLDKCLSAFNLTEAKLLYTYPNIINRNQFFCMVDAPTKNLHKTVEQIEQLGFETRFIHNF